jgi:2-methylcitrate dehydratase PrpD
MTDDASLALSRFASCLSLATLPEAVVSVLKRQVLDTLGVMLAASGIGEGCPEMLALVARQGGSPEATALGLPQRVPATAAAFANGALAHALDFDDLYEPGIAHVAAATVPAALAAAERRAVPVSGADFLAALAAGGEVICRLSRATMTDGAVPTKLGSQVFGYFGAAAAAGRVLGLTAERMHSAFGLALMQTAGTMEIVHATESVGKCIYEAFSNQGGVQSALLAELGLPVAAASLEGEAGLFRAHFDGRYDRATLVDDLGEGFLLADLSFKAWPASKLTHPFVQAGLELLARNAAVRADTIDAVVVHVGPWGRAFCEPLAERARPRSSATAKNSIPFTLAKALTHGRLTLADFTEDGLHDPVAQALADRVMPHFVAELATAAGTEAGVVELRTAAGTTSARVDVALGHPSQPLDFDAIAAKFQECATYAKRRPSEAALKGCVDLVAGLPSVSDVRTLLSTLRV